MGRLIWKGPGVLSVRVGPDIAPGEVIPDGAVKPGRLQQLQHKIQPAPAPRETRPFSVRSASAPSVPETRDASPPPAEPAPPASEPEPVASASEETADLDAPKKKKSGGKSKKKKNHK